MKPEPIAGAVKRAADLYGKIIRKRTDVRNALDRLIPDLDGTGVRTADLIIEAVPEKLELKQKVYAGLEPQMKPGAILATNTSSIPLQDLRTTLQSPQRLVGLHFFNPVSRLQLVEVVSHDAVDPQILAEAMAFVGAIDRLPLPVKSSPGFLVNRALTPYMNSCPDRVSKLCSIRAMSLSSMQAAAWSLRRRPCEGGNDGAH